MLAYVPLHSIENASAQCIFVTGILLEELEVVGPEYKGGQIIEVTGRMEWR